MASSGTRRYLIDLSNVDEQYEQILSEARNRSRSPLEGTVRRARYSDSNQSLLNRNRSRNVEASSSSFRSESAAPLVEGTVRRARYSDSNENLLHPNRRRDVEASSSSFRSESAAPLMEGAVRRARYSDSNENLLHPNRRGDVEACSSSFRSESAAPLMEGTVRRARYSDSIENLLHPNRRRDVEASSSSFRSKSAAPLLALLCNQKKMARHNMSQAPGPGNQRSINYSPKVILLGQTNRRKPLEKKVDPLYQRLGLIRDIVVLNRQLTENQVIHKLEEEFERQLKDSVIIGFFISSGKELRPIDIGSLPRLAENLSKCYKQQTIYLQASEDLFDSIDDAVSSDDDESDIRNLTMSLCHPRIEPVKRPIHLLFY